MPSPCSHVSHNGVRCKSCIMERSGLQTCDASGALATVPPDGACVTSVACVALVGRGTRARRPRTSSAFLSQRRCGSTSEIFRSAARQQSSCVHRKHSRRQHIGPQPEVKCKTATPASECPGTHSVANRPIIRSSFGAAITLPGTLSNGQPLGRCRRKRRARQSMRSKDAVEASPSTV